MTFATQLQSFQGSNTYQNSNGANCIPIWSTNQVYITGGNGGWTKMAKVNVVGGTEADFANLSGLNDPTLNVNIAFGAPWGWSPDGQLYCTSGLGMSRIDPATWTRHDSWGAVSYGLFPPPLPDSTGSNNALQGVLTTCTNSSSQTYLICGGVGGFGFNGNDVYAQRLNQFAGLHYVGYDPGTPSGCNGPDNSGYVYYTTHVTSGSNPALLYKIVCNPSSWVPADWPTPNSGITKTTLASIAPTDIDAAWGNIQFDGLVVDKSDNNILVIFKGDAGSNRAYLTKINKATGAIIWKTATDNNAHPGSHMRFSNVKGRYYLYVTGNIYGYSTSDGSLIIHQTSGVSGLTSGEQMWDDDTGVIIGNFLQTTPGPDSPAILNTTPAFVANSTAWMALYVTSAGGGPGTGGNGRVRVWGNMPK